MNEKATRSPSPAGLAGAAAIIGVHELKPQRLAAVAPMTSLEQWMRLTKAALEDAGVRGEEVDGIVATRIAESEKFVPATIAEYLGLRINFAEYVDLGGATAAGMVWRAAAAIELGMADVVVCVVPAGPVLGATAPEPPSTAPSATNFAGSSSALLGSPQAEFELPFGNVAQNAGYAMIANRYAAEYPLDRNALAKIAVDQRTNACSYPDAFFHGRPITIDDVLRSPMIAEPLRLLDIVMRVAGGAAVVVASEDYVRRNSRHRPVWITGCGEHVAFKTPTYAADLVHTPIKPAADRAFAMAGVARGDIDMVSLYDCYTITVLMSIEDAGFCEKGSAGRFILDHDLTFRGDFPCNTAGGQLSFGQTYTAGGMHHVCDAARQLMGRAGATQVANCNRAFVSGNGGIMSEQVALILEGD